MIAFVLLFAAALVSLWAGFKGYTPANFSHFQVDHHENRDGELTWNEM